MKRKLSGGQLLDLIDGSLTPCEVLIDTVQGTVLALGTDLPEADETIFLHGEWLLPGLIDLHVHLREPGQTHKETIASGTLAAAAGGFTQVACMPNTIPPLDTPQRVRDVVQRGKAAGAAQVRPIACITRDQQGQELTDFAGLKEAGAVAISDDGKGVQDGGLMREALVIAASLNLPVAIHAEDASIARGGLMNPGAAAKFQVPPLSASAEAAMVARDLLLAEETGAHLHVCHVSAEPTVALIRFAKARGVQVTAEVTPHHLLLSEEAVRLDDGVFKVNPPLRSERDRMACWEGLLDGTLDVVATDHAPHTRDEKAQGIWKSPFGMVGSEFVLPLLYTHLVVLHQWPLQRLMHAMSLRPAQVFGLHGGVLRVGGPADLTVFDGSFKTYIDPQKMHSKGQNTPFAGWPVNGRVRLTLVAGQVIYRETEGTTS